MFVLRVLAADLYLTCHNWERLVVGAGKGRTQGVGAIYSLIHLPYWMKHNSDRMRNCTLIYFSIYIKY